MADAFDKLRDVIVDRMNEIAEAEEHALDTVYADDFDAKDGAYYELSRLKILIELAKIPEDSKTTPGDTE